MSDWNADVLPGWLSGMKYNYNFRIAIDRSDDAHDLRLRLEWGFRWTVDTRRAQNAIP